MQTNSRFIKVSKRELGRGCTVYNERGTKRAREFRNKGRCAKMVGGRVVCSGYVKNLQDGCWEVMFSVLGGSVWVWGGNFDRL